MVSIRSVPVRFLSVGGFALVAVLSSACFGWGGVRGSGKVIKESRELKPFDRVSAAAGIDLDLTVGPQTAAVVEGDDNLVPLVETVVTGGALEIRFVERDVHSDHGIVVHLQVQALSEVSVSGGSKARGEVASPEELALSASGGGEVRLHKVGTRRLVARGSGGARLELEGKAESVEVSLSGGSTLGAARLATARVKIDGSGGCTAQVSASESVRGGLSGGCALDVQGRAKVKVATSGGSSVGRE